MWKFPSCNSC